MNTNGAVLGALLAGGVSLIAASVMMLRPARLAQALTALNERTETSLNYQALIEKLSASSISIFKDQDLAILGKERSQVVAATVATIGIAAATIVLLASALLRGILPLGQLTFLAGSALAAAAVIIKVATIRTDAAKRRKEARAAITVWLNFVALATAFHPIEGSIRIACNAGNTWTFKAMRAALEEANIRKIRIWEALSETGRDWGVRELNDIGTALEHASLHGAKVREALTAKSETMTTKATALELAEANKRTAKLQGPIALTTIALFGLMLYPAAAEFTSLL